MKSLGIVGANVLVATALFSGGCGGSTSEVPSELGYAFNVTRDYWQDQGVTGVGRVALKMSSEAGPACQEAIAVSPLVFCFDKAKLTGNIVVSDHYKGEVKRAQSAGISINAMAAAAIGHELGHAVMNMRYAIVANPEQIADCLAGVAVKSTQPELVGPAGDYLGVLGGAEYGDRATSFRNGADGGILACDPKLPIQLGIPAPVAS